MNKEPIKVLVTGAFDVLHRGHLDLFKQAKALGDELHVVVGRSKTIEQVKGKKPWYTAEDRAQKVQESSSDVDFVHIGYIDDKYRILEEIRPDIIALGYDQTHFVESLEEELKVRKIFAKIVRLKPFKEHKYKSSLIKAAPLDLENE